MIANYAVRCEFIAHNQGVPGSSPGGPTAENKPRHIKDGVFQKEGRVIKRAVRVGKGRKNTNHNTNQ